MSSSVSVAPSAADCAPLRILRVPGWELIPGLVAGFCGRLGGVSQPPFAALNLSERVGDDVTAVRRNWQRVATAAGGALHCVTMRQVHGATIAQVHDATMGNVADPAVDVGEADAMVSRAAPVCLGVLTADCVPLLLVAARQHVVAAVHAGWRGTLAGIAPRTLRHLREQCGAEPDSVRAALGPAIGGCCYEVDAGVADALEEQWGSMPEAIGRGASVGVAAGKATVDLRRVNRVQLLAAGMPAAAIAAVGPCTRCAVTEYFSHRAATRAGTTTGRQLSFVGWNA